MSASITLRMLTQRHLVDVQDGLYRARASQMPLLRYYANSIAHLLVPATDAAQTAVAAPAA